jgi:peptide/nickel transport system substrate-binding protein
MGRSRTRGRPRFAWIGLLALFAVLLAACAAPAAPPPPPLHLGGSVTIGLSATPGVLLPDAAGDPATVEVDAAIWSPLFYEDANLAIHPELAEAVPTINNGDISPDGKTITIRLRPNLMWSDGQPLTATDVAYTFDMLASADYAPALAFPLGELVSAAALDPLTVQLALSRPDATLVTRYLADAAIFAPLPKHVFGSSTPAALATTAEGALPAVTSGPFIVTNRTADEIDLAKNPRFNQAPKPSLDHVVFKSFEDPAALVAALQSGAVDTASNLPNSTYAALSSLPGYALAPSTNPAGFDALYLNLSNPILADPIVREALAIGLDPTPLRATLWHGLAQPTCDDASGTTAHQANLITTSGQCAYGPDGKTYDPAAANTLLQGDGWTLGADGLRVKAGQRLTLKITVAQGDTEQHAIAQQAISAWETLGVLATEVGTPATALQSTALHPTTGSGNPAYDIAALQSSLGADPDDTALFASTATPQQGGDNITSYANAQVDTWEQRQLATLDPIARAKLLDQIHAQVLKDIPLIFVCATPQLTVAKTSLHNYAPSGVGPSETWNIADWWIDGANETPTAIPS